ncbi:beta-lactamase family protein [Bradyrhizobium sp. U87765 SZCCT0131]|uniref:serine hydrolase domain-containing protein n=1 Tax=unclassified Bradyrhizobium TaxID=2631580 RepID=UPI001BAD1558|nr:MULTISPECIES: serine hydrolase domain-containing protein [unclassified Bradyrhizobium]MBR1222838.1 beta-lactamase family protein [Bradyrhizobium sp. U87765 SZCCT0131]MBR1262574.1 beta-lactamase family protein [Bradyrhizobium sp. U87765 SZCCT0134]MBR1308954.1 beta-lactamase family protein [Bradyrhizobium sp. U87765 SZCCT0110]MBR1318356.1 beta-lactamase family protein [Bradyrhizobium sp. U87765 SZCCT0109]MBR1352060.1 beta-lactamase family protein [Bradyrhizobium sp. U87765 SZCCT0048]
MRRRVISFVVTVVVALLAGPVLAEAPSGSTAGFSAAGLGKIDSYFDNEVSSGKIPGAIVLIQRHGKPVYLKSFGVRDVTTRLPMSPDTIFRIFSMSKPITAVTAVMLIDQGKMKLDDPLSKYIPSFADVKVGVETRQPDGTAKLDLVPPDRPVTIEDLLRQSSGITYGFYGDTLVRKAYREANLFRPELTNATFADRIAKLPLEVQPGTIWDYGHSMDVMGRVIEVISGKSLYETEKAMLLDPLGMTDTAYYVADPARFPLIAEPLPNDKTFVAALERDVRQPTTWEAGGSGMVSTVTDYARFAQMLANGGELDGRRYMSEAAFRNMTTNHIAPATQVRKGPFYFPGDGFGYGLGFGVRIDRGDRDPPGSIGEFKWDGAGGTYFFVDPKNDMFVVFMVQSPSQRGRIHQELKKMIYEALEP